MIRSHRALAAATLTTFALLTAGCTGPAPAPSTSPTETVAPPSPQAPASASPTPSPAEDFDPHPPLADLRLSTSGLLPLTLGVAPDTNPGAAMITFDVEYCLIPELDLTEGDLGRWVPTYEDSPFRVGAADTEVYRIDVLAPGLLTTEDIGIGSSLGDLQAAYPRLVAGSSGIVSHVWWVQDENGTLVFETQNAAMNGSIPAVPGDQVVLMRALSHAWGDYIDWAAANSGDVADACF